MIATVPAAVAAVTVAFTVTYAVVALLVRPDARLRILDEPGERSLHAHPVPRGGGLGILAGVFASQLVLGAGGLLPAGWPWIGAGAALLAAVSFADDVRDLPPALRLLVHVLAAVALVVAGGAGGSAPLMLLLAVPAVVWMINLYNFMDGMDGFASGMAVAGFGTLAVLGGIKGDVAFVASALTIAAAGLAFLRFNFPPARIFLGDVGSCTLGYLAAYMILRAHRDGVAPLWIGMLVFAPFIFDATTTLARRLRDGDQVWTPHRKHVYQHAVRSGLSHRHTVLGEYGLMALCAAAAIAATGVGPGMQLAIAATVCAVLVAATWWVFRRPVW